MLYNKMSQYLEDLHKSESVFSKRPLYFVIKSLYYLFFCICNSKILFLTL